MNKNIRVILNSKDVDLNFITKCIYNKNNNTIKYIENDDLKTIAIFNFNDYTLTRKNSKMTLKYKFIESKLTKGELNLKENNLSMEIDVVTNKIIKQSNYICIEFKVFEEPMKYIIEVM